MRVWGLGFRVSGLWGSGFGGWEGVQEHKSCVFQAWRSSLAAEGSRGEGWGGAEEAYLPMAFPARPFVMLARKTTPKTLSQSLRPLIALMALVQRSREALLYEATEDDRLLQSMGQVPVWRPAPRQQWQPATGPPTRMGL